jgi:hypothetical protein
MKITLSDMLASTLHLCPGKIPTVPAQHPGIGQPRAERHRREWRERRGWSLTEFASCSGRAYGNRED